MQQLINFLTLYLYNKKRLLLVKLLNILNNK